VLIAFYPSIDFTGTFTGTCLSGRTILLKNNKLKLVPVAGLEPIPPHL
jgi:hypothetical protein